MGAHGRAHLAREPVKGKRPLSWASCYVCASRSWARCDRVSSGRDGHAYTYLRPLYFVVRSHSCKLLTMGWLRGRARNSPFPPKPDRALSVCLFTPGCR